MAIVQNTLIGRSKGRVGNAVFSTWKGRNILKQKAEIVANPRSSLQQANRARFLALLALGKALRPVAQLGFKEYAATVTWLNRFMSTNSTNNTFSWNEATVTWDLNPERIIVAEGSLYPEPLIFNEIDDDNMIVDWDISLKANQQLSDRFIGVAYTATSLVFCRYEDGATREDGNHVFNFPAGTLVNGVEVTVLGFFIQETKELVSNSFAINQVVGP